jgi:NADH:ubiquinone oxidoreductase subunit E
MSDVLFYKKHFFICTNKKKDGTGCGHFSSTEELLTELKSLSRVINQEDPKKIRVSSSGCLGRCKEGPMAVLYPQGKWFHTGQEEELEQLKRSFNED